MNPDLKPSRKTEAGMLALILALALIIPWLICMAAMFLFKDRAGKIVERISNFIFDFGAIIILLVIGFAIVGAIQGGRSRKLSGIAFLAIVLFIVFALF